MRIGMVLFGELRSDYRVYREATALQDEGHDVILVAGVRTREMPAAWQRLDVRLVYLDPKYSLRRAYPLFWHRAHTELKDIRADVYHAHDLDALWPATRAARRWNVPLLYDSHELWTRQSSLVARAPVRWFWTVLERRLIRHAHRVITVGPAIGEILRERYHLEEVVVIRNLPMFRPPVAGDHLRQRLGLSDARPILLYQGGFLTGNGLPEQIEAMAQVAQAHLVLLGSGPTEEALRRQVEISLLGDRVHFLNRVPFDELHELTCSADVGLCLIRPTGESFYYSMPNKLFEYMMAGLPVLGSNCPGIQTVVETTGIGQIVDPTDVDAVAQALAGLATDAGRRQEYSAASRQAARTYCWEQESPKLTTLYAQL